MTAYYTERSNVNQMPMHTSLILSDCDSIPNGALNTNQINIALNIKFGIEFQA